MATGDRYSRQIEIMHCCKLPLIQQSGGRRSVVAAVDGVRVNLLIDTGSDTFISERRVSVEKLSRALPSSGRAALGPSKSKLARFSFSIPGIIDQLEIEAFVGHYADAAIDGELNIMCLRKYGHILVDFIRDTLTLYSREENISRICKEENLEQIGIVDVSGSTLYPRIVAKTARWGSRRNVSVLLDTGASCTIVASHLCKERSWGSIWLRDFEGNKALAKKAPGSVLYVYPFELEFPEAVYCEPALGPDVRLGMDVLRLFKILLPTTPNQKVILAYGGVDIPSSSVDELQHGPIASSKTKTRG